MSFEPWQLSIPTDAPAWFKQYHEDVVRCLEAIAESIPNNDQIAEAAVHECVVDGYEFGDVQAKADRVDSVLDRLMLLLGRPIPSGAQAAEVRQLREETLPPAKKPLPDVSAKT